MDKEALFSFFGGLALGAIGVGVFLTKKYQKVVDDRDEEWAEYVEYLEAESAKHCSDCQTRHDDEIVEDDHVMSEESEALVEMLNTMASSDADPEELDNLDIYKDENGIISYDKFSKNKNKEDEAETAEDDNEEDTDTDDRVQDEYLDEDNEEDERIITFISADEYEDDENDPNWETIALTYLEGSDTFVTDDRDKYNAYPAIGGKIVLDDAFRESATGVVYIRNEALEMDFAIVSDIRDYDTYMKETEPKE